MLAGSGEILTLWIFYEVDLDERFAHLMPHR